MIPLGETSGDERLVARAVLLILKATLPDYAVFAPDRVLLLLFETPVSDDEAVTWLAARGKPVQCKAEVRGDAVAVDCRPLTPEKRIFLESGVRWVTEEYGVLSLEEVEKARRHSPTPILLVGRDGETLSVGLGDFVRLTREYLILGHYYQIGRYPTREQTNASFVIEYSRSHSHSFVITLGDNAR